MNVLKFEIAMFQDRKKYYIDLVNPDIKMRVTKTSKGVETTIQKPANKQRRQLISELSPSLESLADGLSQYIEQFQQDETQWKEYQFEKFWEAYDKKVAKSSAYKVFMKLSTKEIEEINAGIKNYIEATPIIQYRPHPTTFLNQKRWRDEISIDTSADIDYATVSML